MRAEELAAQSGIPDLAARDGQSSDRTAERLGTSIHGRRRSSPTRMPVRPRSTPGVRASNTSPHYRSGCLQERGDSAFHCVAAQVMELIGGSQATGSPMWLRPATIRTGHHRDSRAGGDRKQMLFGLDVDADLTEGWPGLQGRTRTPRRLHLQVSASAGRDDDHQHPTR